MVRKQNKKTHDRSNLTQLTQPYVQPYMTLVGTVVAEKWPRHRLRLVRGPHIERAVLTDWRRYYVSPQICGHIR